MPVSIKDHYVNSNDLIRIYNDGINIAKNRVW